jgi:hypothetical protein
MILLEYHGRLEALLAETKSAVEAVSQIELLGRTRMDPVGI